MSSLSRSIAILSGALLALACEREARPFREIAPAVQPSTAHRVSPNQPGPVTEVRGVESPYDANAFAIAEGKRLYSWFNCVGCHAHGGGAIGPALMDDAWIYGGRGDDIFASIVEGRPNGMPSYGGKIPAQQVWQIVAYVRSLGGHVRKDAAPGRADAMHTRQRELALETEKIRSGPGKDHP